MRKSLIGALHWPEYCKQDVSRLRKLNELNSGFIVNGKLSIEKILHISFYYLIAE